MADLLRSTKLSSEQLDYVESIQSSAGQLLNTVRDILDISKIKSGFMEVEQVPFNLSLLLTEVWKITSIESAYVYFLFWYDHWTVSLI